MLRDRLPSPSFESRMATEVLGSSSWKETFMRRFAATEGPANLQGAGWGSRDRRGETEFGCAGGDPAARSEPGKHQRRRPGEADARDLLQRDERRGQHERGQRDPVDVMQVEPDQERITPDQGCAPRAER